MDTLKKMFALKSNQSFTNDFLKSEFNLQIITDCEQGTNYFMYPYKFQYILPVEPTTRKRHFIHVVIV
jgi:hypothetical protein